MALLLGGKCGQKTGTIMVKSGAIGVSTRYFDADTGEEITSAQYHHRCRHFATIPMEID